MQRSPSFQLMLLAALLVTVGSSGCARNSASTHPDAERQRFATMFARGYVQGRSGQMFVVPDSGYFLISREDSLYHYMHGTPWPCDTHVPLVFYGAAFVRTGS